MPRKNDKPSKADKAARREAPLEKVIVGRVMDEAERLGFFTLKIHGGPFGRRGIPDVLAIKDGRAYWMEAKRPGEEPTRVQVTMMKKLMAAGCPVAVVCSAGDARAFLEGGRD